MNYKTLLILGSLTTAVFAAHPAPEQKPAKVSYDTDLFRKHKKVIFANAEFLYWTVSEGSLEYAIKMKQPPSNVDNTDAIGHYKIADFGWNPGFRLNVGYFNAPHYWDAYIQYTYFTGTGHDRADKPDAANLLLNGTWPQPSTSSLASAHSDIKLMTNMLEFLVTRRFHPNPHLRMRVYGGVEVAWLRQNWEINYADIENNTSHLHNHWQYTGAGLRLGFIIDWFMGKGGFFITAQTSAACFAGDYHNVSKQTIDAPGFNPTLPFRNAHYRDTRVVPQFQAMAGPSWQQAFRGWRTEVFIGYELNIWSNLHEVIHSIPGSAASSKQTFIDNSLVGIQGVTLRWNVDF